MRWACILLPQLALDAVLRQRGDDDTPLALITGSSQRRVLQAVNEAARAQGLRAGQTLTAAQALCHGFATLEYDLGAIERSHSLLAAWAYGFSSHVSRHYPRTLLLEVESSLGLFGPWPRFEARLREELAALGFRHRITLAPNPAAARVLANVHDGLAVSTPHALRDVLTTLPVGRAGLPAEVATSLSRMGLRRLGQVLALPRETLARRFPKAVQLHLETLLGERAMALDCYRPPDRFEARIEFNFEVESHQALLFPLRRLTADLAAFLAGRDSGVQRFILHLEHRALPDSQVAVGLLAAEREAGMLFELARGRLEQLELPAPTLAMRLLAEHLPAFVPERRELFDDRPQLNLPWEQLRERLRARLGDDVVQAVAARADHRPERSWCLQAEIASVLSVQGLPPRPGWLLREPEPLAEAGARVLAGPERIESGWWDAGDVRRDYYLVETRSGRLAWAFRRYGEAGPLHLHGWFA